MWSENPFSSYYDKTIFYVRKSSNKLLALKLLFFFEVCICTMYVHLYLCIAYVYVCASMCMLITERMRLSPSLFLCVCLFLHIYTFIVCVDVCNWHSIIKSCVYYVYNFFFYFSYCLKRRKIEGKKQQFHCVTLCSPPLFFWLYL